MFRFLPVKIVLLLNICFALHVGAEDKQVVTEMQVSSNDSIFKYSYLYNNRTLPVVETKTLKKGTNWENISQTEWFRQSDMLTQQVERLWENNKWNDIYWIRYENVDSKTIETHSVITHQIEAQTYETETVIYKIETEFSNTLKTIETNYSNLNGNWQKTLEKHFYYSAAKLPDSTIINQYTNSELALSYKIGYNFNPDSSLKSVLVSEKAGNESTYSQLSKAIYSYKANALTSLRNYNWNKKSSLWENGTKLEYLYNASGNVLEEILWEWNSMFWKQVMRYNYEYDAENQIYKKLVSTPIYRDWRNTNSVNYLREPDSRNMTIESVYGFWGGKSGEKLNTHISFPFNDETIIRRAETIQLSYAPFVESGENKRSETSLITVFPNPSYGIFYISNFDASNSSWKLSGLNGSVLRNSLTNVSTSIIDISDLPNGIYLLNIRNNNIQINCKIMKN